MFSYPIPAAPPLPRPRSFRRGGPILIKALWPGVLEELAEACAREDRPFPDRAPVAAAHPPDPRSRAA